MKKNDIAEIFKIGIILFLITSLSAGALAAVNTVTAPIIEQNEQKKRDEAMAKVMPDAQTFEKTEYTSEDSSVTEVYTAGDSGWVILCEPKGYSGAISMVVGVNNDLTVNGVDITSQSETAGLGANCVNEEFKGQFAGKTSGITVTKNGASDNEIDAISSATITSKAVTKGVNDALSAAEELAEVNK